MSTPSYGVDGFQMRNTPYAFRVIGTLSTHQGQPSDEVAEMVLSPILAKLLAIKLRKAVHQYEEQLGPIAISAALAQSEGLSPTEDWD